MDVLRNVHAHATSILPGIEGGKLRVELLGHFLCVL